MAKHITRNERNKLEYEGKEFLSMDNEPFVITEYRKRDDVTIRFLNSGFEKDTSIHYIESGKVKSPFYGKESQPIIFTDCVKELVGTKYFIDGIIYEIIDFKDRFNVVYKCHDEFGYVGITNIYSARAGSFINPYKKNKDGSYLGEDLTYRSKQYEFVLHKWHGVIERCTGLSFLYNYTKGRPSIATKNSRVCKQWLCYGEFANWFVPTWNSLNHNEDIDYHVDKDLMYSFYKQYTGIYKLYSPITCELLPMEINSILFDPSVERNEYFRSKIVDFAEYFISINAISQRAYDAIQLIYNQNQNIQISMSGIEQYLEFASRVDNFEQFY